MNPSVMLPWAQTVWQRTSPTAASWTAHALPLPSLDINDRTPHDAGSLVSLAVALDVLSTRTRTLQDAQDRQVLARLTELTWELGALASDPPTAPARLLQLAASGEATARAWVSQDMCTELAKHAAAAGERPENFSITSHL